METTTNKLKGFKVYEFYLPGSQKTRWAIAKSKKDLNQNYFNELKKIYLRDDVEIDESLNFAPVILKDAKMPSGATEITLEEYLNN